jgi:hypothetical protein
MNLSMLLWYRAAAVDFMHRPASRIRLTSRTRVREIFEICVQFFRTFTFVPLQSVTSPKPQYESRSFNNPISPSSPSPQAQTDLYTTDEDHANAMQADWKARWFRIPNVLRHDQCSPCRKIPNHDPLRARRWMKVNFWKKWGSSPQNESQKKYSQSELRLAYGCFSLGDSVDTRIGPYLCRPNCPQRIKFVIRLSLPKHSRLIPKVVMKQVREAHITNG